MIELIADYRTKPTGFGQCKGAVRPSRSRLIDACDEAADVLAYLGLLPPKSIGIETARNLIATCLSWHNKTCDRRLSDWHFDAAGAEAIIEYGKLDIQVSDDKCLSGRLCVTAVSLFDAGPFVAFMLSTTFPAGNASPRPLEASRPQRGK